MLIICPRGGLANRMRVIASALQLAGRFGDSVKCVWKVFEELGADYEDIFELISSVPIVNENFVKPRSTYKPSVISFLKKVWNKMFCGIDVCLKYNDYVELIGTATTEDLKRVNAYLSPLLSTKRVVYVETCSLLAPIDDVSMFHPVHSLMEKIDDVAKSFSNNTYGVHIRRTDNDWAKENSPIELFIERIESVINDDGDALFYLSSDDGDVMDTMSDRFGNRIITRDKDYNRATQDGVKDAVIDMWLLSRTKKIFGSYYSSFSEMASWIGNIPLEVIKR